ncbi:hypothetical protein HDU92_006965, partial [Lobulomyces angularis]
GVVVSRVERVECRIVVGDDRIVVMSVVVAAVVVKSVVVATAVVKSVVVATVVVKTSEFLSILL